MPSKIDIYPLTIVYDRYSGVYSGGIYTAWNQIPQDIPHEISDTDEVCAEFWANHANGTIGKGRTPQDAVEDLYKKLLQKMLSDKADCCAIESNPIRPDWLDVEPINQVYRIGSNGNTVIVAIYQITENDDEFGTKTGDISFNIWEEDGTFYNGGFFTPNTPNPDIEWIFGEILGNTKIDIETYVEI